jgi:hypothetical protein
MLSALNSGSLGAYIRRPTRASTSCGRTSFSTSGRDARRQPFTIILSPPSLVSGKRGLDIPVFRNYNTHKFL